MSSRSLKASVYAGPLMLATMFSVAACQSILPTPTAGTEERAAEAEAALARHICQEAWLPTTYSSRDTPETQLGNRANNAARDAFCRED